MEVSVLNIKGQETGRKVTLNEAIFGIEPNDHVLYLDVKQYLANQRQGTAKSKERSEISGSTRKLIIRVWSHANGLHFVNSLHIFATYFEVEDLEILLDTCLLCRFN